MSARATPAPAILELGGFTWRDGGPQDAAALQELAGRGSNRALFQLPEFTTEFMREPSKPGFRQTMVCHHRSVPFGAGAYNMRSLQSLNLKLICFFVEPELAACALAMYVRHLFWGLPLHRVHAQLPLDEAGAAYVRLLKAVGFRDEGVVRAYALMDGQPCDLAVLGVLRAEFDDWCKTNEPRLSL